MEIVPKVSFSWGRMAEWLKAPVLKTGVPIGAAGSNPVPSSFCVVPVAKVMELVDMGDFQQLQVQRVIWEKPQNENAENCWDTLRALTTTALLEMAGAMVIKLSEIGQSAAEPLNAKAHGEGSETMHGAPLCG